MCADRERAMTDDLTLRALPGRWPLAAGALGVVLVVVVVMQRGAGEAQCAERHGRARNAALTAPAQNSVATPSSNQVLTKRTSVSGR